MIDTRSLDEFQRDAPRFIEEVRSTQSPLTITLGGEAGVVVQDARAYRQMTDDLERMRLAIALLEGGADIATGRTQDADEFFAELEAEFGVQA